MNMKMGISMRTVSLLVLIAGAVSSARERRFLEVASESSTHIGTFITGSETNVTFITVPSKIVTTPEENITTVTTPPEENVTLSTVEHSNGTSLTTVTSAPSTTQTPDNNTYPLYVGFICAGIAVVFYGSNFVPVKKFDTGDGMFFQWCLCSGIFLVGIVVQIVLSSPFRPFVMIGGAIWSTGNMCVVPIIKTIGMGLGLCIWGTFNLLSGWASGRFGWFGINPEIPVHEDLNYIGVTLCILSSFIYMFVKPEVGPLNVEVVVDAKVEGETDPLMQNQRTTLYGTNPQDVLVFNKRRTATVSTPMTVMGSNIINADADDQHVLQDHSVFNHMSTFKKRVVGISLSIVSGLMYGLCFSPAIYWQDHHADKNSLDYVFSHFCGILLTSSFYFFVYIAIKKNRPKVYPRVILPAIASGIMWGVATACWFIANKVLSEPVSFPIVTTIPGGIASLFWGVLVFREIKGRKNIMILLLAFTVTVAGSVLAGISRG